MKRPLCLASVLFLGIWLLLAGRGHLVKDPPPTLLEQYVQDGEQIVLQGVVCRREERAEYQIYYLTDVQIRLKEHFIEESKILVYVEQISNQMREQTIENEEGEESGENGRITIGSKVQASGEITFFEEARNPGNFDQKFYYRKEGIPAYLWTDSFQVIERKEPGIREYLVRLRGKWKQLFLQCLGEEYGNCMSAILLGDRSELDKEKKALYQKSGIGHILAISGLHMSFLGIGMYQILRKCGISFWGAGMIGIVFLALYTWMIGSGVSSQRALIMFVVRVGADLCGREYDLPTSLALAAAVIVFRQPLYLFDAGFLLSFGALLGIIVVEPVLKSYRIVPRIFQGGLAIQIVLLPILLYYYYEIPTYSIFLNLAVIPLMSCVLGAGVLGSMAAVVNVQAGTMILSICKWILSSYEIGARGSLFLPCGRILIGQPKKAWIVIYYLCLFAACAAARYAKGKIEQQEEKKKVQSIVFWKKRIRTGILFGIVFFCMLTIWEHQSPGKLQVTMIDVGQGDGIYLKSPSGKRCLIDGGSTDVTAVGEYRIAPFLKNQGTRRLDYVFVSHGDEDHLNGIRELLLTQEYGIRVDTLVLPDEHVLDRTLKELARTAEENGTKVAVIHAGEWWTDNGMCLKCLAPTNEYAGESGNAASMVLELTYGDFEMLFTGDVEGEGEKMLVQEGILKQYDVLKVSHHGSKNSTSAAFLEQTNPKIAWISAGIDNRYGHPHKETIERLQRIESRIIKTQDCGAVTISINRAKIRMEMFCKIEDFPI